MARAVPLTAGDPVSLPPVSVVVPAYNAAATIDACVRSLLALDYPHDRVEVIVVDNRSTDDTAERLARLVASQPAHDTMPVRILHEATRGPAAARNSGLRRAAHDLVAMTDADCEVEAQWLRRLIAPLDDPTIGLVGGRIRAMPHGNAIERFGEEIHDHAAAITRYVPPYVITMNWASRRAHLDAHGYFDEAFLRAEDVELSYRFTRAGVRFAYAPDAVVHHQNERTLGGLFREGYDHGVHGRQVARVHGDWLASQGHVSLAARPVRALARALRAFSGDSDPVLARCRAVFGLGKELGKMAGAWRFRGGLP